MALTNDGDDAANPFAAASDFDDVNLAAQGPGAGGFALGDASVQRDLAAGDGFVDFDAHDGAASTSDISLASGSTGNPAIGLSGSMGPAQTYELPPVPTGLLAPFKVEYYMPYFNVTTEDVVERLKRVAMPWKNDFFEAVDARPDLYAPFWVCAALVFLIASTSNFASWIDHDSSSATEWQHDFKVLGLGASFVFGFALAMPFVAWGCFTYLGVSTANMTFIELACVYGYSISPFLVACVVCIVPALEWPAVILALGWSAVFLLRNLWARIATSNDGYVPPMDTESGEQPLQDAGSLLGDQTSPQGRKLAATLLAGVIGLHVVFAMVLKLKFFGRSA
ncbi:Protein YIPF1-like [Hondaea fermentalgiana]|uniref:Protein YIPF n=1 Tax=Hondaea fermentalgiana TaxID=2315210 RepID=A0A2R5G1Z2_9STRA|nr:Protein YIPF1-like [Hondaea fermentalgiana]|eukprot:GBG25012.1 Protein YIPF1-like [Hondaea fermentalgiana]